MRTRIGLTLCLLLASPALAQDGGVADAATICGDVDFIGECQGNVVRWCDTDAQGHVVLIEVDCADPADPGGYGVATACGLLDCSDPQDPACRGYFCVARAGQACGRGADDPQCDVASGHGCLGGVCAASQACVPETYVRTCTGSRLTDCPFARVWDRDCAQGGGAYTCGGGSTGAKTCLGLEGADCDLVNGVECAADLQCQRGVCEALSAYDAGVADASEADVPPTGGKIERPKGAAADDGCGCGAHPAAPWGLGLLALLFAVGRHRRGG